MHLVKNFAIAAAMAALLTAADAAAQGPAPAVGAAPPPAAMTPGQPTVKWALDPDDEWLGMPAGKGREQVFYTCPRCHSLMLVRQQGLDRATWDETLDWMVREQKMDPMDPNDRALALDYLAEWFGPDRKALKQQKR